MSRLHQALFYRATAVINRFTAWLPRTLLEAYSGWHNAVSLHYLPADTIDRYWSQTTDPYRLEILDALRPLVMGRSTFSLLEVGSHVGINLKLIEEAFPETRFTFYAFDPKAEFIDSLRTQLPHVSTKAYSGVEWAADDGFPPHHIDASLSAGVLYYLPPKEARAVVDKMCRTSRNVILNETLTYQSAEQSHHYSPTYFWHPYRKWVEENGLRVVNEIKSVLDHHARNGVLVASK